MCYESADVWEYVHLRVVLKYAACVGGVSGYIVVRLVIIVMFC